MRAWTREAQDCLEQVNCLSLEQLEFLFDMGTIYLGITHRCLDSRSAFHRHMSKIVCYFFEGPPNFASAMGKIMSEVMKAEVSDEFPLFMIRLVFETTKPCMNTVFRQM